VAGEVGLGLAMSRRRYAANGGTLGAQSGRLRVWRELALFVVALRNLGTARTGAYFCGAILRRRPALLLGDPLTPQLISRHADGTRRLATPDGTSRASASATMEHSHRHVLTRIIGTHDPS
jgi:hypothetical protein